MPVASTRGRGRRSINAKYDRVLCLARNKPPATASTLLPDRQSAQAKARTVAQRALDRQAELIEKLGFAPPLPSSSATAQVGRTFVSPRFGTGQREAHTWPAADRAETNPCHAPPVSVPAPQWLFDAAGGTYQQKSITIPPSLTHQNVTELRAPESWANCAASTAFQPPLPSSHTWPGQAATDAMAAPRMPHSAPEFAQTAHHPSTLSHAQGLTHTVPLLLTPYGLVSTDGRPVLLPGTHSGTPQQLDLPSFPVLQWAPQRNFQPAIQQTPGALSQRSVHFPTPSNSYHVHDTPQWHPHDDIPQALPVPASPGPLRVPRDSGHSREPFPQPRALTPPYSPQLLPLQEPPRVVLYSPDLTSHYYGSDEELSFEHNSLQDTRKTLNDNPSLPTHVPFIDDQSFDDGANNLAVWSKSDIDWAKPTQTWSASNHEWEGESLGRRSGSDSPASQWSTPDSGALDISQHHETTKESWCEPLLPQSHGTPPPPPLPLAPSVHPSKLPDPRGRQIVKMLEKAAAELAEASDEYAPGTEVGHLAEEQNASQVEPVIVVEHLSQEQRPGYDLQEHTGSDLKEPFTDGKLGHLCGSPHLPHCASPLDNAPVAPDEDELLLKDDDSIPGGVCMDMDADMDLQLRTTQVHDDPPSAAMLFTGAPPTPAATTSSAIPITSPTPTAWHMATPRHDSNPGALPTPSRMRRATERAWTTLAAMQRVSDPVGLATPAPDFPDSPARAPSKVDPYAGSRTAWGPDTSVGSQDELESIASFSDVSERPPMPTLGEQQQRSDPAPPHATFSDHPLSVGVQQVEEGRYTPTPTPPREVNKVVKRVRFAGLDDDDDDIGFTIWRDGY